MAPESNDTDGASGGLLARGWRPSARVQATVLILVGLLAIVHPVVGGLPDAVGLTGSAEYTAIGVEPSGEDLEFAREVDGRSAEGLLYEEGGLGLVGCYVDSDTECDLERLLVENNETITGSRPTGWTGYTYHDRFYERVATEREEGTELGLRPVRAAEVLANVSIPARDWPDPIRRAVENGQTRADPPLPYTGTVLRQGEEYYVVVQTDGPHQDEQPGPLYSVVSAVVGVAAFRSGIRRTTGNSSHE